MNVHRYYIFGSLGLAGCSGTVIGLAMLASLTGLLDSGAPLQLLVLHGQLQVFGFVTLFSLGMVILLVTSSLGRELRSPGAALGALGLFLTGTVVTGFGWPQVGTPLWSLGAGVLGLELARTYLESPAKSRRRLPFDTVGLRLLGSALGWLVLAVGASAFYRMASLDLALWGFAGLLIFGVGLRFQPAMLGGRRGSQGTAGLGGVCWSLGLALRYSPLGPYWLPITAVGAVLLLTALRPFRRPERAAAGGAWLRSYLRIAYGWLPIALVLQGVVEFGRPEYASTARHVFSVGFILTMIMGMGLRMLPAYECRRLSCDRAPWLLLVLITGGGLLRTWGSLAGWRAGEALGGLLQGLSILGFAALLLHTMTGPKLQPPELRSNSSLRLDGGQGSLGSRSSEMKATGASSHSVWGGLGQGLRMEQR